MTRFYVAVLVEVDSGLDDPLHAQTFVAAAFNEILESYRTEGDLASDHIGRVSIYIDEAKEVEEEPDRWWRKYTFDAGTGEVEEAGEYGMNGEDDIDPEDLANIPFE